MRNGNAITPKYNDLKGGFDERAQKHVLRL